MIRNPFFPRLTWVIRSHEAGSFPRYAPIMPSPSDRRVLLSSVLSPPATVGVQEG